MQKRLDKMDKLIEVILTKTNYIYMTEAEKQMTVDFYTEAYKDLETKLKIKFEQKQIKQTKTKEK